MASAEEAIQNAGASGQLLADFRAIRDATAMDGAPRYAARPVLNWLARFITGREGGPNRDAPLYELCHLMNAVDASGPDTDNLASFFMQEGRITPAVCAGRIDGALSRGGWQRDGFTRQEDGIRIQYADGEFKIHFGRMSFLVALYEFICSMDDYAYYTDLSGLVDEIRPGANKIRTIQTASNSLSRALRKYRSTHLRFTGQNERFELIYNFLRERHQTERLRVEDNDLLDFWRQHATGNDFKNYKTVFNSFSNFIQAMDDVARSRMTEGAASIGIDRDEGETDPGDDTLDLASLGDWRTPFALLDEEPAAQIKFFKNRGERDVIENLMEHGPRAIALPLAFLRLEAFGPLQAGITTDLQVKRGKESIRQRMSCEDSEPYVERHAKYGNVQHHVRELQKATFHALKNADRQHSGNVTPLHPTDPVSSFEAARRNDNLPELDSAAVADVTAEAARAFKKLTRKGFDDSALIDETKIDGFYVGAAAILAIATQLENFLSEMDRLDAKSIGLDALHYKDKQTFKDQFATIYGAMI